MKSISSSRNLAINLSMHTRFNISVKINTLLQLVLFYHESFHGIIMQD